MWSIHQVSIGDLVRLDNGGQVLTVTRHEDPHYPYSWAITEWRVSLDNGQIVDVKRLTLHVRIPASSTRGFFFYTSMSFFIDHMHDTYVCFITYCHVIRSRAVANNWLIATNSSMRNAGVRFFVDLL